MHDPFLTSDEAPPIPGHVPVNIYIYIYMAFRMLYICDQYIRLRHLPLMASNWLTIPAIITMLYIIGLIIGVC